MVCCPWIGFLCMSIKFMWHLGKLESGQIGVKSIFELDMQSKANIITENIIVKANNYK